MALPEIGQEVLVRGTVLRTRGEGRDIPYQTVDIQLADGQFLQTNVRNLWSPTDALPVTPRVPNPPPPPVAVTDSASLEAPAPRKRGRPKNQNR